MMISWNNFGKSQEATGTSPTPSAPRVEAAGGTERRQGLVGAAGRAWWHSDQPGFDRRPASPRAGRQGRWRSGGS